MKKLRILSNIQDLKFLRDLYKKEFVKTRHGFYTLSNFVRWFELDPHLDFIKVYVINETWRENGFFIIEDQYQLFMNCVTYDEEEVSEALMAFDWSKRYKVTALPATLKDILERVLHKMKIEHSMATLRIYERELNSISHIELRCPDDYIIRQLSVSDANTINNLWYSRQDGSLDFLESLIKYNISLGIYARDNNELIAWCTRCPCGFMGTLHVREEYRRHGFASLLINEFTRRLAETNETIRVMVNENNHMSTNLFMKFDFHFEEKVFILFCEPRDS